MDGLLEPPGVAGVARIQYGGGGARTRIVCGFLGGGPELGVLLSNLPAMMVTRLAGMPGGDWLSRSFTYAAQTMAEGDPGAATVMAKMSELLFVESVRRRWQIAITR